MGGGPRTARQDRSQQGNLEDQRTGDDSSRSKGPMQRLVEIEGDGKEERQYYQGIPLPAVLCRPRAVKGLVHQRMTVDTRDHEDHSFNGIMFDVCCSAALPVHYIEIKSLWVRGRLGPELTVWSATGGYRNAKLANWQCLYKGPRSRSFKELIEVVLDEPITLHPGAVCALYVHSSSESDDGIVYDNQRGNAKHDDGVLEIRSGQAHISSEPFSQQGFWGGSAWRQRREFVGRISYGTRWLRWNPEVHAKFPYQFKLMARQLFRSLEQQHTAVSVLSGECLMYIINKVPWNALGEDEDLIPSHGHKRPRSAIMDESDGEAAANDGALASFVQLMNTDGASYDGSTDSSEYENPFDSSDGEYDEAPWP